MTIAILYLCEKAKKYLQNMILTPYMEGPYNRDY